MQTCGPWANARCRRALSRRMSNRSGSANVSGSRFAPASEIVTSSRRADRGTGERDVAGRVAVDDRGGGLEPQRLFDGVREQARVAARPARGQPGRSADGESRSRSSPRSSRCLRTSARRRSRRPRRARGRRSRPRRRPGATATGRGRASARSVARERGEGSASASRELVAGGHPRDGLDHRVVPAEHRRRRRRPRDRARTRRPPTASGPARLRLSSARRLASMRVEQPVGLRRDELREPLLHRRRGETRARTGRDGGRARRRRA